MFDVKLVLETSEPKDIPQKDKKRVNLFILLSLNLLIEGKKNADLEWVNKGIRRPE
jgi:hypothetical protein